MTEERETLEADVLFVGGGPACLAGAIRLAQLVKDNGIELEDGIFVVEKAAEVGNHQLSGAILDPRALTELLPDWEKLDPPPPFEADVAGERMYYLTQGGKIRMPLPPPMQNHGNKVTSLNKLTKWLGEIAEKNEIEVLAGFPAAEILWDGTRVVGVQTGDQGIGHDGKNKANFEPGTNIKAKVTIFGEGSRGSLTKKLVAKLGLDAGCNPQIYSTGVKEVWEVPEGRIAPGDVIHTAGWPIDWETFGGSFIYGMDKNHVSLGFVVSLDAPDPFLDPHRKFQEWKSHPLVKGIIEGGKLVRYGAKTIPEGGWYSIPRPWFDGGMLVGDSAGFLNMSRLKGIHLAMKSGMLAAETAIEALEKKDPSAKVTEGYQRRLDESWLKKELYRVRNFRQPFQRGFLTGAFFAGLGTVTFGLLPWGRWTLESDHERMRKLPDAERRLAAREPDESQPEMSIKGDGTLIYDKLTDVYNSETNHEEDQPCHLVVADTDVCHNRCTYEYGNPCQYFCPANVYEMLKAEAEPAGGGDEAADGSAAAATATATSAPPRTLKINFSNCVHCKTCDIRDPYQIITWVTPEGGGGPNYTGL